MSMREHEHGTGAAGRMAGLLLVLCTVLLSASLPARAANDAGVAGAYLRFGGSARNLAMGGAAAAVGADVSTAYWNPAGLSQLRTTEITVMGATLFEDTQYSFLSCGLPSVGKGAFALSCAFAGSGSFERATLWEDLDSEFSESEGIFSLSYALGTSRIGWGVSLKSVSQQIAGVSGSGLGADVGLYLRPDRHLALGISLQNALQPEILLEETGELLPRTVRGGLAIHLLENRFTILGDLLKTDGMDADFQGGLELWIRDDLVLRGGRDTVHGQTGFGAGLRHENWQVDYAFVTHELGSSSVLSATMRFGIYRGVEVNRDKPRFSPSGNNRNVELAIGTAIKGGIRNWRLEILDLSGNLVKQMSGKGGPPESLTWGGEDDMGRLVPDGTYQASVIVLDDLGQKWQAEASVDILGFRNRTRTPIHIDVSGSESRLSDGKEK